MGKGLLLLLFLHRDGRGAVFSYPPPFFVSFCVACSWLWMQTTEEGGGGLPISLESVGLATGP
jgi:hypothetical protein